MARGFFPTRPDIVSCLSGYVRAPGEADGQLASMYHLDMVDAVASLDGDVVVHGVGVVYTKVNYTTGMCVRYRYSNWARLVPPPSLDQTEPSAPISRVDKKAAADAKSDREGPILTLLKSVLSPNELAPDASKFTLNHLALLYKVPKYLHLKSSGKREAQVDFILKTLSGAPMTVKAAPEHRISTSFWDLRALICEHGPDVLIVYAVLAGCDYVKLKGCGPGKASQILQVAYANGQVPDLNCLVQSVCEVVPSLTEATVRPALSNALLAFRHPVVFNPISQGFEYSHYSALDTLDPTVVGTLPRNENDLNAAMNAVLCLVPPPDSVVCPEPTPVEVIQLAGDAVPTRLLCWMVPGSRPSLLPAEAPMELLKAEMELHDVDVQGPDAVVRDRATRARITVRKPACSLSVAECQGVLRAREIPIKQGATLDLIREDVTNLYALEDTPEYGPPRLVDPRGIALHMHLHRAGLMQLTPQQDEDFKIPTDGFVSPSLAPPLPMHVVRHWFADVGENPVGEYKSRQLREAWRRLKNRTCLLNFGYHGPTAVQLADDGDLLSSSLPAQQDDVGDGAEDDVARGDGLLEGDLVVEPVETIPDPVRQPDLTKDQDGRPREDFCYFKMDVPASMLTLTYECIVACAMLAGSIIKVVAARCSGECPAGLSGLCVHVAAVLLAAANVLRPTLRDADQSAIPTSARCLWNHPGTGRTYNFLRPVCMIPFTKEDINHLDKKQNRPCMDPALARWNFNPYPENVTFRARNNEDMVGLIRTLCDLLRRDHDGKMSSLEELWPFDYAGGQHDGDDPMWSLRAARRWEVLAGDYLADKGFRIQAFLARYLAGLYKPPHRLRGRTQLTSDGVRTTQVVANMRIHVERDMRRAREFHILNKTVPISHIDLAGQEAFIAFMLTNFAPGLTGKDFFDAKFQ
jgi:hypothetical protein